MKNIFNNFILLVITSSIISCNSYSQKSNANISSNFTQIEKANWLIGAWQNNSAKVNVSEIWKKKNDSTYIGQGRTIMGKDTVSSESISMEQRDKQLFYISTVKNQNNGQGVKFTLTSSTDKQLVFENPAHDFPQKISYTVITNDSLVTEVSGMMKGKPRSEKFPMTRVE